MHLCLSLTLQLRVTIKNAVASDNPEEPVLIIEIRASGRLGEASKSDTDPWFDRAHDAIISCFVGMTNEEIQHKYWIQWRKVSDYARNSGCDEL